MTRRRQQDDDRRPRRFDPKQRGRDHTRTRRRRKRGQTEQTTERRIEQLETWSYLNTSVATQAAATTLIEVVTELPDATYLDIGRQIILRSPAAVHDILYVGMQLPDDTVAWIQWTSIYEDSPNSPEFTWDKNYSQGANHRMVYMNATDVYFTRDTLDVQRYTISTGAVVTPSNVIPSGSNAGYGVYAVFGTNYLIWCCVPGINKVEFRQTVPATSWTSSDTQNFWAMSFDVAGDRLLFTDRAGNRCAYTTQTGIRIAGGITSFATDCLTPEGIAADSSGNIYVADTGNNRMRKYNSSLVHQLNWGNAGTGEGQFNAPKGVAVDSADRIYVCDSGNNRIQVFSNTGTYLGKFGIGGSGNDQFSAPNDISIYGSSIVVNDAGNSRLSFWTRT